MEPSLSLEFAVTVMEAGATNVAPAPGDVSEIVGGLFGTAAAGGADGVGGVGDAAAPPMLTESKAVVAYQLALSLVTTIPT